MMNHQMMRIINDDDRDNDNDDHEIHDHDDAEDDCYLLSVVT